MSSHNIDCCSIDYVSLLCSATGELFFNKSLRLCIPNMGSTYQMTMAHICVLFVLNAEILMESPCVHTSKHRKPDQG